MTSARKKVSIFVLSISALTLFVQWDGSTLFLDNVIGIPWSGGFVSFLKTNTQGLIVFILLAIYLEFVGLDKPEEKNRLEKRALSRILEHALNSSEPRALVRHGLELEYGEDASNELVNHVLRKTPELEDFTVRINVARSADGFFDIKLLYTYDAKLARYLIAITDDSLTAETLLSSGKLAEVFIEQNISADMQAPPVSVDCMVKTEADTEVLGDLIFFELTLKQKSILFEKSLSIESLNKARIFEGKLQKGKKWNVTDTKKFRVLYITKQDITHPYTFWLSDRVLRIKSIEVDLSALGKATYEKARIHLFIASLDWSADITPRDGVWTLPLDSYLVNGQGILVFWPSRGFQANV